MTHGCNNMKIQIRHPNLLHILQPSVPQLHEGPLTTISAPSLPSIMLGSTLSRASMVVCSCADNPAYVVAGPSTVGCSPPLRYAIVASAAMVTRLTCMGRAYLARERHVSVTVRPTDWPRNGRWRQRKQTSSHCNGGRAHSHVRREGRLHERLFRDRRGGAFREAVLQMARGAEHERDRDVVEADR
ncbi:hypothetical protein MRB53_039287 [Persea americana]|nr:hypothetical protein MRB53_039287 [Persea americana]